MELLDLQQYEILEDKIKIITLNEEGIPCTDVISFGSISFWREALGVEKPSDAVLGYLHYANSIEKFHDGLEPEENQEMVQSLRREISSARNSSLVEERTAEIEGTVSDPRSPQLRGMVKELEAYNSLEIKQVQFQERVGLGDLVVRKNVSSREGRFEIQDRTDCPKWSAFCDALDEDARDTLEEAHRLYDRHYLKENNGT